MLIEHPMVVSAFVAQTSCKRQACHDVIFHGCAEVVTVAIVDGHLPVCHPIRVGELLLGHIGPALHVCIERGIIGFEFVFVSIPVFTSWEEIGTRERIAQETRGSLVLDVLFVQSCAYVYVDVVKHIESHFCQKIVAIVSVARCDAVRAHIGIGEIRRNLFCSACDSNRIVRGEARAEEVFGIVFSCSAQRVAPAKGAAVAHAVLVLELR